MKPRVAHLIKAARKRLGSFADCQSGKSIKRIIDRIIGKFIGRLLSGSTPNPPVGSIEKAKTWSLGWQSGL